MRTRFAPATLWILTLASGAFGQQLAPPPTEPAADASLDAIEPAMTGAPCTNCAAPAAQPDRFWTDFDALGWWVKGASLPPLVTTSPAGTARVSAGVLGAPGTSVLFGAARVNSDLRFGGRVKLGYWFDPEQTVGIQGSFFDLQSLSSSYNAGSSGNPILARPFLDATTGLPASSLIAFPGLLSGNVQATASSSTFYGADALLRENICCGKTWRLDALAGYRFLRLGDGVGISESLTNLSSAGLVPVGTTLVASDAFRATNTFNGFDCGFAWQTRHGRWVVDASAKLAVGRTGQTMQINGATAITVPGSAPVVSSGGLLALGSNIGTFHDNVWTLVPEFGGRVSYQINPTVTCFAGYTFLYWSDVVRSGSQIDLGVNPTLIPPATGGNSLARPAPLLHGSDLWAQGINLGLEFRF